MLRGVLHAHSTYSDGEFSLGELRETFLAAGCRFLFVTDHAEAFDDERLAAYITECEQRSDDRFVFVPGLEFECERRLHVLGYGTTRLAGSTDPEAVIRHIAASGGVSVIAHPKTAIFPWIESFEELPLGVEVWNSKYDGRYAPRPETFHLLRRLQARKPAMRAFYGQDLHWRTQPRALFVDIDVSVPTRTMLLEAIAAGRFAGVKGQLRLSATGEVDDQLLSRFGRVNNRAARMKRFLSVARDTARRLGATVPGPLKSQLRRFF